MQIAVMDKSTSSIILLFLQTVNLISEDSLLLLHGQLLLLAQGRIWISSSSSSCALAIHRRGHLGAERGRERVGAALPSATFALQIHTKSRTITKRVSVRTPLTFDSPRLTEMVHREEVAGCSTQNVPITVQFRSFCAHRHTNKCTNYLQFGCTSFSVLQQSLQVRKETTVQKKSDANR